MIAKPDNKEWLDYSVADYGDREDNEKSEQVYLMLENYLNHPG